MRLSEAIRLGAMLKPQGFGFGSGHPTASATCALGSAYEASNCGDGWWNLEKCFPIVNLLPTKCPSCGDAMPSMVPHLNDDHRWSRERIADWVELIETSLEPAQADPAVVASGELAKRELSTRVKV